MLFGSSDENGYWLASLCINIHSDCTLFGLRYVYGGHISGNTLVNSDGTGEGVTIGVRAVVTLSSNVSL